MKWLHGLLREDSGVPSEYQPDALSDHPDRPLPVTPEPQSFASEAEGALAATFPGTVEDDMSKASAADQIAEQSTVIHSPAGDHPALRIVLDELQASQARLGEKQLELNELFATRLRSDEAQARAVDKLHDELRQYKNGFQRQQLLPLLKETICCHDFLATELARIRSTGDDAAAPAGQWRALEVAAQMLLDLLFKYDVEPFRIEDGPFDPRSQQCTRTIATDRPELDKQVAARGLEGFRGPEGVIRREQVSVYKFEPGAS